MKLSVCAVQRQGAVFATAIVLALLPWVTPPARAAAPVGAGFTVTNGDLGFILKQIKIAERHVRTATAADPCGTLVGTAAGQVRDRTTPWGLRTVDGSCNNLYTGRTRYAAVNGQFPRLTRGTWADAEPSLPAFGPVHGTSYTQTKGSVFDSRPRTVSNLVSDQTAKNPAAVAAAGHPATPFGAKAYVPCTTDPDPVDGSSGVPTGCIPSGQTLPVPNISTDAGLSPPVNGLAALFGQFFDHGLDQTVKGGGTVFVPLRDDDPLVLGKDGRAGTSDDLPADLRFMVMTRARNQPGPDGTLGTADDVRDATNTDTPWIDQSQTYGSHSSMQVFLREYALVDGRPSDTGRLLGGTPGTPGEGGMATWSELKKQAADVLGLRLADTDVSAVPMLAADPYGNFLPGPHGLPQYVTPTGLVEGDLTQPVTVPSNVTRESAGFLTDIAHDADPAQVGTAYDAGLLGAHYVAGDGRVNENIGLTAVHQVFHAEHDRLVADVDRVLRSDTSAAGVAALADWHDGAAAGGWSYGQRLFQAARFVTEMEYQHIAVEEFARKITPGIPAFTAYHPEVDPAVSAEFAHSVYRFGHSMLTDVIGRTTPAGASYATPLLDGFLAPRAYTSDGHGGRLTPRAAAGGLMLGMSDQVGNEIDEFVTETLRNNLLGLPLDLATLNIARGRSEGIPGLNGFRRQLFAATHDGRLTPYTSWSDLGQHLKHPETLVNLVAAYGTYPTVREVGPDGVAGNADDVTTVAAKRAAAQELVNPVSGGASTTDQTDFLDSTGAWADDGTGVSRTGLDQVDLWVGGLAEATQPFGGLLGTTFEVVFEDQIADLQNGDRFYYLARTAGLNLRAELEGNSFAELVERNTDGTEALKADAFATADCTFALAHLSGSPAGFAASGSTVADDPTTPCNESVLLLRKPDGTLQYRTANAADPAGVNGQAVYDGSSGVDRVIGGNDADTLWGNDGADVLDGGSGNDVVLGGEGDDRITDSGGLDILKGGPGDDALDAGAGNDILVGGTGSDVTNGGANDNETFAGPGDDFSLGGSGTDSIFGGGGSDWVEGGGGSDVLVGDHGAPFLDDQAEREPGNDVLLGQAGDNTYDAEGGDDLMGQGVGIDRNLGGAGYDWATHQDATGPTDDDLLVNGGAVAGVVVNRDRWLETEGVSGTAYADTLRGDDEVPRTLGGLGFSGCDALDAKGVARVSGLAALLPALTHDPAPVAAASVAGSCPLVGPVWGEGNVLLGGAGSDVLEGRGGDDVLDGDRVLAVRISVRTDPADPATQYGSTDLLGRPYRAGSSTTLQQALFDGTVRARDLVVVREILPAGTASDTDTAVFSGPRSNYTLTPVGDAVQVTQTGPDLKTQKVSDGSDLVRNVERLQFSDRTVAVATPAAPTALSATAGNSSAVVSWTPAPDGDRPATTGFELEVRSGGSLVSTVTGISSTTTSRTVLRLTPGTAYTFRVHALNTFGGGAWSADSTAVTPYATATAPPAPSSVTTVPGNGSAVVSWTSAGDGGSPLTGAEVQVRSGTTLVRTVTLSGSATSTTVTGLTNGTAYAFTVRALNVVGASPWSVASAPVTPVSVPDAPVIGKPTRGAAGGALTATATWSAPKSTGGSPVTSYRVVALQLVKGAVVASTELRAEATARSATFTLAAGSWVFQVAASNTVGESLQSSRSASVSPR